MSHGAEQRGVRPTNVHANARRSDTGHSMLDMAAAQGYTEAIKTILARGADVNSATPDGRTALHCASFWDQAGAVDLLIASGARLEVSDGRGCTPLHVAAENGATSAIVALVNGGADKCKVNSDGRSPLLVAVENGRLTAATVLLHASEEDNAGFVDRRYGSDEYSALDLAACGGHQQILKMLIRHGCDVNAGDSDGVTALYLAALNDQPCSIDVLVKAGAKVEARSPGRHRWSALHVACAYGSNEAVSALLTHDALLFGRDASNHTPLHLAVQHGHDSTVEILLRWGSDPTYISCVSACRYSPLDVAASLGHMKALQAMCVHMRDKATWEYKRAVGDALYAAILSDQVGAMKWLMSVGASVNNTWAKKGGALQVAALAGSTGAAEALLAAGASITYRCDENNRSALDIATKNGHVGVMRALIQHGADVNNADPPNETTALHLAGESDQVASIDLLVKCGSDLDAADILGSSPLHAATVANSASAVAALVRHGADVNKANGLGRSPLHLAAADASDHRLAALKALLAAGADVALRVAGVPDDQPNALDLAAGAGHVGAITALIQAGALVDARDGDGRTALICAVKSNKPGAVDALAEAGADVEAHLIDESWTSLHSAAEDTHLEVVRVLLKHRADVHARDADNDNDTPLHVAVRQAGVEGAFEIVQELLLHGADEGQKNDSGLTPASVVGSAAAAGVGDPALPVLVELALLPVAELLARAPADRAWRRRGLLILCCARLKKEKSSGKEKKRKDEKQRAGGGEGVVVDSRGTSDGGREGQERRGEKDSFDGVVAWLVGVSEEGLFRTVVGFL
ncbi:unnamed protein product [Ectocarpus fasciculatus]